MANYKLGVALVALFVASCTAASIDARITDSHNIDQCDPTKAISKLLVTNINEPASLFSPAVRTITYPENGINKKEITCLKVINTDTSNHGGYPEIVSGGVGAYDVQIRLTAQWLQPLKFRIEIWADKS